MGTALPSVDPPADLARLHGQTVAMNEALILGAVRQHQLNDAAESLNAPLQKAARALAEKPRLLDLSKDAIIVRGFDDRESTAGRRTPHRHDRLRQPEDLIAAKRGGFDEHFVQPVELEILREWLRSQTENQVKNAN